MDNGKVEITETIDNGNEVKKKTYIQEKDVKKLGSWNDLQTLF